MSVQDPHSDHSDHPTVVVANVVVAIVVAGEVVVAAVVDIDSGLVAVVIGTGVVSAVFVVDALIAVSTSVVAT